MYHCQVQVQIDSAEVENMQCMLMPEVSCEVVITQTVSIKITVSAASEEQACLHINHHLVLMVNRVCA